MTDHSPYQNIPPQEGSEVYNVEGSVYPAIDGDHDVSLLTIQPDEEAARKRFTWHFEQMGRRVVEIYTAEKRPNAEYGDGQDE